MNCSRSTPEICVSVRNIGQRFAGNQILNGITLDIAQGDFVVMLGASGSGKTTFLRALAGLTLPSEGSIKASGQNAVVFQEPRLLPWRTVLQNVELCLPAEKDVGSARKALEEVGLDHRLNAWPQSLSGGEAQRVALARALVVEPELILLDEPFGALDALTRLKMQAMLLALWRSHNATTFMVTHDVDEAIFLARRILVLRDGRILTDRTIRNSNDELLTEPHVLREALLEDLQVHTFILNRNNSK